MLTRVLLLALAAAPWCLSQIQAGRMAGTVYDPNKAVVPGAAVTVTNQSTGVARRVVANELGGYVVAALDPGLYDVSATAPGFRTTVRSGVEMQVGKDLLLDLDLVLGETNVLVEVRAEVPLLSSESGALGHVMTNYQITDLPLNGRGFNELARLTPGVVHLPGTGSVNRIRPEFFNGTTISGVRGRQVSYYLDGADTSEQHQGGSWIQTSIDALQEFSVQQNAYSAEHSRSGSFFNATTKGGSNRFHGSLFEFVRNEKLDARNFFLAQREVLKRNTFGGSLGGPVVIPRLYNGRNRTFFFAAWEAMRERQGLVINRTSPTPAMLAGDFSAPGLNTIYDPLTTTGTTRSPFAGNRIPASRLSPQASFFNPYIPTSPTPGGRLTFAPSRALDEDQVTVRADQNLNDRHKLFVRWSWHDHRLSEPGNAPTLGNAPLDTTGQNVTASLTSNLRSSLLNEFRYNALWGLIGLEAYLQGRDFNKEAGIRGLEETRRSFDIGSFPDFNWSGYTGLAGSTFDQRPKTQDRYAWEITNNLTWIKNRHVVKFGTKIRYYQWLGTDSKTYVGLWSFDGRNTENPASPARTGDAFADWALGLPATGQRAYPSDTFGGDSRAWHLFVQDDFKVSNRLTLNLGLRYEFTPWMSAYRGQTGTFDGTQVRPLIVASRTREIDLGAQPGARVAYGYLRDLIQTSSEAGLPYSITYPDRKQWAPRFGLAWRPFRESTVVRGGYGVFYETEYSDRRVNLFMPPFLLQDSNLNDRGTIPRRTLADFYLGAQLGSPSSVIGLTPTYTRLRVGYDQHWNFGVQQQIAKRMVFDVEYVGNKGTQIQGNNAFNIPTPGAGAVQARRPFPRYSGFSYLSSDVSTTYHALQFKLERRLSAGLWFLTSYTYSKSLWAENTPSSGGRYAFTRFPSEFHVPHSFAHSFGYELPFGKGRKLLGGWQLQGIFLFRSGVPYTVTVARDIANTGVGGQRPNRVGSGKLDKPTLERWFDPTAFVIAPNFTYGNSGIRILPPDIQRIIDFSLFKQFRISEGSRLQFRFEVFNLPNTPSFAAPTSNIDAGTVGRVNSTVTAPRQMQAAVKYHF
jgi:hypothetical protein